MRQVIVFLYLFCAVLCAAQLYVGCPAGKIPGDVWTDPHCVEVQCLPLGFVKQLRYCDKPKKLTDPYCSYTFMDGPYPQCCEAVKSCSK
ncbi:hypothetical protein BsWGS_07416 [Bradybaena similaris]